MNTSRKQIKIAAIGVGEFGSKITRKISEDNRGNILTISIDWRQTILAESSAYKEIRARKNAILRRVKSETLFTNCNVTWFIMKSQNKTQHQIHKKKGKQNEKNRSFCRREQFLLHTEEARLGG